MSEARFTRGPWEVRTHGDIFAGEFTLVAQIYDNPGHEEADANAHLIAAAPEMYEMLEYIDSQNIVGVNDCDLQTLLKKARGEYV